MRDVGRGMLHAGVLHEGLLHGDVAWRVAQGVWDGECLAQRCVAWEGVALASVAREVLHGACCTRV